MVSVTKQDDFEPYAGIYSGDAIADRTRGEVLALRAEIERLHLELQRHQVTGDYEMGQHHTNAALEAEVERLRAVLFKIADDSAHADQYVQWAQEALGR